LNTSGSSANGIDHVCTRSIVRYTPDFKCQMVELVRVVAHPPRLQGVSARRTVSWMRSERPGSIPWKRGRRRSIHCLRGSHRSDAARCCSSTEARSCCAPPLAIRHNRTQAEGRA
jgi:hypothetical protein